MDMRKIIKHQLVSGSKDGLAALFVVVVVSAVALILGYGAMMLGLGELDMGYTHQKGGEALAVAEGCVDESLRRIKLDNDYGIGGGMMTLVLVDGTCEVVVTEPVVNERLVNVTGWVEEYYKRIEVRLTLSGGVITIEGWKEG
jgi:hypothetical protein